MPGKGSYGPGGKWIHDRAHRIMEKGKTESKYGGKDGKRVAYAIATQQAHKMGKAPKKRGGYGTAEGRSTAQEKFTMPRSEYRKTAASKIVSRMNGLLKCRQGKRPARVETLLKRASQSGADLRLPVMGGAKFATGDSLSQAKQTLKENQNVGKPKMVRPTMKPVYGGNTMPKLGSRFSEDPLVKFLKKQAAAADGPKDNEDKMELGQRENELSSAPPGPTRDDKTRSEWRKKLDELFSNKDGITGKYLDHHHEYKAGVVDRELQSHGVNLK